jgi:hypothetical protein
MNCDVINGGITEPCLAGKVRDQEKIEKGLYYGTGLIYNLKIRILDFFL